MKLNRRGFLASLAALAVAPKLEAIARVLPAAPVLAPLPITGIAGWLPRLTIMGSVYCPKDRVYFLDGGLVEPQPGVFFFGVDRDGSPQMVKAGTPVVVSHPAGVPELRHALNEAIARVARNAERSAMVA